MPHKFVQNKYVQEVVALSSLKYLSGQKRKKRDSKMGIHAVNADSDHVWFPCRTKIRTYSG